MSKQYETEITLGRAMFGNAQLGDKRRSDRAAMLLAREYVEVLSSWRYHKVCLAMTVHDFYMALARLGGHQNRKHDHAPGWLVLWRGWTKLQSMLDGYLVAKQNKCG